MMMKLIAWGRICATPVALGAVLLVGGCASTETVRYGEVRAIPSAYAPVSRPLSIGEIVAELQAQRPQQQLAADIRERGVLAPATGADIDLLLQHGAGSDVVDSVAAASAPAAPSAATAPAVVVAPAPVTIVREYGWYPWVPFSFGLWWYDGPRRYPGPTSHHRPPPSGWHAPGVQPPRQWQGRPAPAPGSGATPGRMLPGGSRQIKPAGPGSGPGLLKPSR
ncbi:MAG: hypothetical protein EHM83_07245 [Burkholderiales bacterium]|nr:MAG: hypothetical protein EHM83_07245 [Burkholderiales bacterium]